MQRHLTDVLIVAPAAIVMAAGSASALGAINLPATIELSSLNGTTGFAIRGIDASDSSGLRVSRAGDVNGDGHEDIIIGANFADPNGLADGGEAYVVFGGPSVGVSGSIELAALGGTDGFVIFGIDADGRAGRGVSRAGDVNGDGHDDLIVGAYRATSSGLSEAGEVYVIFGGPGVGAGGSVDPSALNGVNGFVMHGIDAVDWCGRSVADAGDINGDGWDDLLIGAELADPNGLGASGEAYVVFGGPGVGASGSVDLSSLNGTNGFMMLGVDPGDLMGRTVSRAGDVNGDGEDDLVVAAFRAGPLGTAASGRSYIVFGGPGVGAGGTIDLATLNGSNGFVCKGIDSGDHSGRSVSDAGDVNGDGFDDVIIGAPRADRPLLGAVGESYVVFGGPGVGAGGIVELSSMNGTNGFTALGIGQSDFSGVAVSGAGDFNGDGYSDVIIGAYLGDPSGRESAGECYVIFGGSTTGAGGLIDLGTLSGSDGITINGVDPDDFAGYSVSDAGDVNGDGYDDVIIGAYGADPNGASGAGTTYVVFGGVAPPVCAGDINRDGFTNAADFTIMAGNFGASVTPNTGGDLNGDGVVNSADFVILAGDFGCAG